MATVSVTVAQKVLDIYADIIKKELTKVYDNNDPFREIHLKETLMSMTEEMNDHYKTHIKDFKAKKATKAMKAMKTMKTMKATKAMKSVK